MAGTEKFTFAEHGTVAFDPQAIYRSPHVNGNVPSLRFTQGMGGIAHDGLTVIAAMRHPALIPSAIHPTGEVEYGGTQLDKMLEGSNQRVRGKEEARNQARAIINTVQEQGIQEAHKVFGGVFGVGIEQEMWTIDRQTGNLTTAPNQEELQDSVWEVATAPFIDPRNQAIAMAKDMYTRSREKALIVNNTSVPIGSSPLEMRLNADEGMIGRYVQSVQWNLFNNHLTPNDAVTREIWDELAKQYGYENFEVLKQEKGDLGLWACTAAHASVGLSHYSERHQGNKDSQYATTEHAIAVTDMFNSNLATVVEAMTYSTPIVFSTQVGVRAQDGTMHYPKDAREALRRVMQTANPSPFILNAETLFDRVTQAMTHGYADRLDRASLYYETVDAQGRPTNVASAHARVRNRMSPGSPHEPYTSTLGRVEFTGCSSTPDPVALMSRNAMLQLMAVCAYEAVANGMHPTEYSEGMFPSVTTCDDQVELSHRFNFMGTNDNQVARIVDEARMFVRYMKGMYKTADMQELCDLAEYGIKRLDEETEAKNLKQYVKNPKGNISDVLRQMYEDGVSIEQLQLDIHNYQLTMAHKILQAGGNVKHLMHE